jgi:hypothetical protein
VGEEISSAHSTTTRKYFHASDKKCPHACDKKCHSSSFRRRQLSSQPPFPHAKTQFAFPEIKMPLLPGRRNNIARKSRRRRLAACRLILAALGNLNRISIFAETF